jgi:tetratricopeptide (TPR) repeat protein
MCRVSSIFFAALVLAGFQAESDLVRQAQQLDLEGNYTEAREALAKAIETASTPQAKAQAQRAMAISYAFTLDCDQATKFEAPVYEYYLAQKDFYDAGEMANELARICIESGRLDEARKWYLTGRDAGLRETNITPARRDLWEFRTEHALARMAARRGAREEAQQHVEKAKTILDKGTNPDQVQFFPYLTGYVAFYLADYKKALADLQQANQRDPFILSLIAQTYEKLGDEVQAKEYYSKVLNVSNAHNPPNAFARPLARRKLAM